MKAEVLVVNGTQVEFEVEQEKVYVSSLEVARTFEKRHDSVIRTIENSSKFSELLTDHKIVVSEYKDSSGKTNKQYLLDRDAFSFFVMGFTGEKAEEWKWAYIQAFNEMERMIREQQQPKLPKTYIEALEKLLESEKEKLRLQEKIEKDKPLVEFASTVGEQAGDMKIGDWIKVVNNHGKLKLGRNRLFKWLRDNKILMKNNIPYQQYIENGYFNVKENIVLMGKDMKPVTTTMITGKGQIWLLSRLREEGIYKD